ncbi:MAG TPA: MEDS domain-containing protein [Verrucomicrobiae bacterium]|jgi:hypothetical protein|nr:MEDS domain-containing protein [Verrucomicrobiae bacterium]
MITMQYPKEALRQKLVKAGIPETKHGFDSLCALMPIDFDGRTYEGMSADIMAEVLLYLIAKDIIKVPVEGGKALLDLPWGTHVCQFYNTKQDLIEILVPYFKQGLENNEACIWVVADLSVEEARRALAAVVPDINARMAKGQMEIRHYTEFYTGPDGNLKPIDALLEQWKAKAQKVEDEGYKGLRASGNTRWIGEDEGMYRFMEYETKVHCAIHSSKMIAVCTYPVRVAALQKARDLILNHGAIFVKRDEWVHRLEKNKDAEKIEALFSCLNKV